MWAHRKWLFLQSTKQPIYPFSRSIIGRRLKKKKLLASEAKQGFVFPAFIPQDAGHMFQSAIADDVTVCVIDLLEMIHIEQCQIWCKCMSMGPRHMLAVLVFQIVAKRQLRKSINSCRVGQQSGF